MRNVFHKNAPHGAGDGFDLTEETFPNAQFIGFADFWRAESDEGKQGEKGAKHEATVLHPLMIRCGDGGWAKMTSGNPIAEIRAMSFWPDAPASEEGVLYVYSVRPDANDMTASEQPRPVWRARSGAEAPDPLICVEYPKGTAPSPVIKTALKNGKKSVAFAPLPSPTPKETPPDALPEEAFEEIDKIRIRFVERGATKPFPRGVLAAVGTGGKYGYIGPFSLTPHTADGQTRWRAPAAVYPYIRSLSPDALVKIPYHGKTVTVIEPSCKELLILENATIDLRSDEVLISRLENGGGIGNGSGDAAEDAAYVRYRLKKAMERREQTGDSWVRLREWTLSLPEVQAQRETAIAEAVANAKAELATQTDAAAQELQNAHARIAALDEILQNRRDALTATETEIRESAARRAESDRADAQETARLTAAQIAGEVTAAVLQEVLSRLPQTPANAPEIAQKPSPFTPRRVWRRGDFDERNISSAAAARSYLMLALNGAGIAGDEAAPALLAAWLAGLTPLLVGDDATKAARVMEDVFLGASDAAPGEDGDLCAISVSPAMEDVSELFGRVAANGTYRPHPAGLADLLRDPTSPESNLRLAAFLNINLTDPAPVFLPLLTAWSSAVYWDKNGQDTENIGRLNLVHPAALAENDPYRLLASAVWPSALPPLLTWCEGVPSPLPPPAFWRRVVVIPVTMGGWPKKLKSTLITRAHWKEMLTQTQKVTLTSGALPPDTVDDRRAQNFAQALKACGVEDAQIAAFVQDNYLLPRQIAAGRTPAASSATASLISAALETGF